MSGKNKKNNKKKKNINERPDLKEYFFDSHLHLFNLSHPGFIMFLSRLFNLRKKTIDDLIGLNIFTIILKPLLLGIALLILIVTVSSFFSIKIIFHKADIFIYPIMIIVIIIIIFIFFIKKYLKKNPISIKNIFNSLYFIENDVANQLLLLERDFVSLDEELVKKSKYLQKVYFNCINKNKTEKANKIFEDEKEKYKNKKIAISINNNGEKIKKVIITPLIMDFGYKKSTSQKIYYRASPSKPMSEQIIDLYFGIAKYIKKSPYKIFEVYPFMGITPANYTLDEINGLLKFYFGKYKRSYNKFQDNFNERFNKNFSLIMDEDRNILSLQDFFFAGIKLYPSLGCDLDPSNKKEIDKINRIYEVCKKKGIPVTIHYGTGGFECIDNVDDLTDPEKIDHMINHYKGIYLNLAHFGLKDKKFNYETTEWTAKIKSVIKNYNNVYTDISCKPYIEIKGLDTILKDAIDENPGLENRILFGSDIPVLLFSIESYKKYLRNFIYLTEINKNYKKFYRENAYDFLFG